MKVLVMTLTLLLSGCAPFATQVYCNTLSEEVREAALKRMQGAWSEYPEHSICDPEGFIIDVLKDEHSK